MASADAVRAGRAALLDLLADLLLRELEMPLAAQLAADPTLAEVLNPPTEVEALSALRAEYTRLLVLDLPPYSSVFLDMPPVIGGDAALRWEQTLAGLGLRLPALERAAAPDHAGLILQALAAAERASHAAALLPMALAWLPQWLTALRRDAEETFYGRVAALAVVALGETTQAAGAPVLLAAGASAPAPGEPEERDLRTLSRWLCTPASSGWLLSKRRLRLLVRPFGGGLGIVDRDQMLQQVFEASGLDGRTDELLAALRAELETWQAALHAWRETLGDWKIALDPWAARLAATDALLAQMHAAAQAAEAG
ncbi:MAG TPA: molecular chaperone TorD family protein [Ktedonobacterales bacterium]|nr:molecular chaperone TorD family protein [Ktedonobacterales bacterium]